MSSLVLPGYTGQVWTSVNAALSYFSANLNTNNLSQTKALAAAMAATMKNACGSIAAYTLYQGIQQVYANLALLLPMSLGLSSANQAFMVSRINALQAAGLSIATLPPAPLLASTQLSTNNPAIADPGYLEWLYGFSFESPPSGLTAANFATQAQAQATAWTTIATALRQSGVTYTGGTYNTVLLMGNAAQAVASILSNLVLPSAISAQQLWNQLVAMPTITRAVSALMNDPTSATAQSTAVIRYVMLQALQQFNELIVSLRQVVVAQGLSLGTVRQGDTPMVFANREAGNYALWQQIMALNGLQPPYFSTTAGPNVAVPGQQLFLPPSNSSPAATAAQQQQAVGASVASYVTNYLGVDKYLGPLNVPMLTWTGDYQIISGYSNLALSLGRRMQTTIGTLMYHSVFGSRIPPLVGQIASDNELALVEQYSIAALMSDPRVNKILSCTATAGPNYFISIVALVLPNGLGQEQVTVNEVIGPA